MDMASRSGAAAKGFHGIASPGNHAARRYMLRDPGPNPHGQPMKYHTSGSTRYACYPSGRPFLLQCLPQGRIILTHPDGF